MKHSSSGLTPPGYAQVISASVAALSTKICTRSARSLPCPQGPWCLPSHTQMPYGCVTAHAPLLAGHGRPAERPPWPADHPGPARAPTVFAHSLNPPAAGHQLPAKRLLATGSVHSRAISTLGPSAADTRSPALATAVCQRFRSASGRPMAQLTMRGCDCRRPPAPATTP